MFLLLHLRTSVPIDVFRPLLVVLLSFTLSLYFVFVDASLSLYLTNAFVLFPPSDLNPLPTLFLSDYITTAFLLGLLHNALIVLQ